MNETTSTPEKQRGRRLAAAILSLSLLTVMAGAAVAPALDVIRSHFTSASSLEIQLVISMPAFFIFLTSFIFPKMASAIRARSLLMIGLCFYVVGGTLAGTMSSIHLILAARALVGIGVGIIMPLSTGLLTFYFSRDKQDLLMGYASAMNQMGAAVATLISGFLATFSWRASFLVYLMGLISIVLCSLWMPNDLVGRKQEQAAEETADERAASKDTALESKPGRLKEDVILQDAQKKEQSLFSRFRLYILTMFLLMVTFFIYPSDFAMETMRDGILDARFIAPIMASMDIVAFFGGLAFVHLKRGLGKNIRFAAPILYVIGYALLAFLRLPAFTLIGSWLVGFANGLGIPFIIAAASLKAGKEAASTLMSMLSGALYLGQFTTPFLLAAVRTVCGSASHLSWFTALATALLLLLCSSFIREKS
ncbi:MAG: MFS transporter [Eubacteriales bacterium]|nr:MFS transporter [Eubacteriales bacterium]